MEFCQFEKIKWILEEPDTQILWILFLFDPISRVTGLLSVLYLEESCYFWKVRYLSQKHLCLIRWICCGKVKLSWEIVLSWMEESLSCTILFDVERDLKMTEVLPWKCVTHPWNNIEGLHCI